METMPKRGIEKPTRTRKPKEGVEKNSWRIGGLNTPDQRKEFDEVPSYLRKGGKGAENVADSIEPDAQFPEDVEVN
jgi:hypothetical protein